jgi:hypothetical protein
VKKKMIALGIIAFVFLFWITSCNPTTPNTTKTIFKELQNRVPFQIVLPIYLPTELKNHIPLIEGPWVNTPTENITSLRITYQKGGEPPKMVEINEKNSPSTSSPADTFFEINGIQIGEYPLEMVGSQILHGLGYNWNSDNINCQINIFGYEQAECRKIIASMIK